ncbi:MAG: hypothetical protein OES38_04575 [Gammaproteobacteria bacterium]|nr:hypothetical protein [Gammaproteobacteria bacterium]
MTHDAITICNTDTRRKHRGHRMEAIARTSATTLLFLIIVALPAGLTYVELALAG